MSSESRAEAYVDQELAWSWLAELMHQETGFQALHTRWNSLSYRLNYLAHEKGFYSAEALVQTLYRHSSQQDQRELIEALLNYETSFFRDWRLYECLKNKILPERLEQQPGQPINIWSAACATGQEAYSLAMLWEEHFVSQAPLNLLASDISQRALKVAREGIYTDRELERQIPQLYRKYLHPLEKQVKITTPLQNRVHFRAQNLIHGWPEMPEMDLILMRNVLIYLKPELKSQIIARVVQKLKPGGYLVLGVTESLVPLPKELQPVFLNQAGGCFKRCHNN